MQAVKAMVRMSELHTQPMIVGEWEIPILQAIHGGADVQVVGSVEIDRELPAPEIEYERLMVRYGNDPEQSGMPFAAQVYGQHGNGVRALAQAIEASQPGKKPRKGKAEPAEEAENPLADVG